MYPITSAVKALYDAEQRQVLRITGTDKNGAAISITDANVVIGGFNIDRYSCNGEKLEVGTAIAAEMTLKLDNHNGTYNGIVFEGAELFVEVGIADWTQDNPTVNWMPCGYFAPDQQPRTANQITIHALDRMVGFDIAVDDTAITLPTTVAGLVGQVCTLCGVTLADDISAYTNASVAITALPTVQYMTYRNLIQWCAGVMATNAWFDWNGELRFSWYEPATGYGMTTANRFTSDYYEDDLTITGAAYTNSSGVEIVEGTDDYTIDLTGNALVGPLVATVLPAINTKVNGFTYRPLTASVINAPYLWPMDVVGFTDKDGNTYSSALTNVAYGLNGATALESKGMTYAINAKAQPSGVTKEQAQIISEVVERVETDIDESLTQQEIFNRLTNNGAAQGMVLYNGQLYINASYINAGELSANFIKGGTLTLGGDDNQFGKIQVLASNGDVRGKWDINSLMTYHLYVRSLLQVGSNNNNNYSSIIDNNEWNMDYTDDEGDSNPLLRLYGSYDTDTGARELLMQTPGVDIRFSRNKAVFYDSIHQLLILDDSNDGKRAIIPGNLSVDGSVQFGTPLPVASGGTGANNATGALNNLGGAKSIRLTGASETVGGIYNALKNMSVGETANVTLGNSAMALLTGSGDSSAAKVTGYGVGHVFRNTTAGDYRFSVTVPYGNYQYAFRADVTATGITTQQVFRYAGTQI